MEYFTMPMIVSSVIFIVAYILIVWDKFDRMAVALAGASIMVLSKVVLTQEKAFHEIDYNTLGLLIGMMVIIMITRRTGIFEYLAIKAAKAAKGEPIRIIILLSLITAFLSAALDNVTTILLIVPVTFSIARELRLDPIPFVISEVFSSNVGGTATLIGDPPNIMIGSSLGFSFMDFVKNNGIISFLILFITTYLLALIYKKKLVTSDEDKKKILSINEAEHIKDKPLLIKSLIILGITILGFLLHGLLHYESSTIAIAGAVFLLLISGKDPEKVLKQVEWKTIFFFAGLFILVGGLKETGVIQLLANAVLGLTQGDLVLTTMAILWVSAIASAFIDNIPFVATMIPMIKNMGEISGMNLNPLWWALSLGACLGGNGTIIGASANVIAVGMSEEQGHKITFGRYLKVAFPLMLLSVGIATVYLYVFYLM